MPRRTQRPFRSRRLRETFTLQRKGAGRYVDLEWVAEEDPAPERVTGVVSPVGPAEARVLEESGIRRSDARNFGVPRADIQPAYSDREADEIIYRGERFLVHAVSPADLEGHSIITGIRIEGQREAA